MVPAAVPGAIVPMSPVVVIAPVVAETVPAARVEHIDTVADVIEIIAPIGFR